MFAHETRLALAIILLYMLGGGVLAYTGRSVIGGFALLAGALLAGVYFRHGLIWLALRRLRRQDYAGVRRLLQWIKHPERLGKPLQGCYYMMAGAIDVFLNKEYDLAEEHLKYAMEIGVGSANNVCICYIILTQLSDLRGRRDMALAYLRMALEIPHDGRLDKGLSRLSAKIEPRNAYRTMPE